MTRTVSLRTRVMLAAIVAVLGLAISDCEDNPACEGPGDWRVKYDGKLNNKS